MGPNRRRRRPGVCAAAAACAMVFAGSASAHAQTLAAGWSGVVSVTHTVHGTDSTGTPYSSTRSATYTFDGRTVPDRTGGWLWVQPITWLATSTGSQNAGECGSTEDPTSLVRWNATGNGEAPESGWVQFRDSGDGTYSYVVEGGGGGGTFPVGMEYDCPDFQNATVSEQPEGASSGVGEQCGPQITFCWYELPAGFTPENVPELKGAVSRTYNTGDTVGVSWKLTRVPPLDPTVTLTALVDGPGSLDAAGLVSNCLDFCQRSMPKNPGLVVAVTARERAPGGFLGWVECPGAQTTTAAGVHVCTVRMDASRRVRARFDPVGGYAPRLIFHPKESHWPADAATFLRRSRLMWFVGRGLRTARVAQKDCHTDAKRILVKDRGDFTATQLRTGKIARRFSFRTRRARRGSWGDCEEYKRYNASRLTAPAAAGQPQHTPPGKAGYYLDVADSYRQGVPPANDSYSNAPPLYYEYAPGRYVAYWFFSAFNNRKFDKHEGDWEHVVVRLDGDGDATEMAYYQHLCPPTTYSWSSMPAHAEDDTHPNVFIAVHGHGAWRTAGITGPFTCKEHKGLFDRRAFGRDWRPWLTGLSSAMLEPWYDLGVGWGREGGLGWGPVGPGKYKSDALPADW